MVELGGGWWCLVVVVCVVVEVSVLVVCAVVVVLVVVGVLVEVVKLHKQCTPCQPMYGRDRVLQRLMRGSQLYSGARLGKVADIDVTYKT